MIHLKTLALILCTLTLNSISMCSQNSRTRPTPLEAFNALKQGNRAHLGLSQTCMTLTPQARIRLENSQHPFAIVVTCSDSRVPAELIFNTQLGEIFVVRTAGHVLESSAIGTVEYGVAVLDSSMILVLGHTRCGAVESTLSSLKTGIRAPDKIEAVIQQIIPAVSHNFEQLSVDQAIWANVRHWVEVLEQQPLLRSALSQGRIIIKGAVYNHVTGEVLFEEPITPSKNGQKK
ncbi:carbonic anhydrase [Vermiphilus pyriformis]|nr:MAG: carbonic anhydrase [Vermiphilus pyriformis]